MTIDSTHSESEIKDQGAVHPTICEKTTEFSIHPSHGEYNSQDLISLDIHAETAISTSDARKSLEQCSSETETGLCITASINYSPSSLQENNYCDENTQEPEILDKESTVDDPRFHVENSNRHVVHEVERLKDMTGHSCSS